MEKVQFGNTGFRVARLGFGAAPAAYLGTERTRAAGLVNKLIDRGVNLIDTAASYPGSEEFLGESISQRRSEIVLISKCGSAKVEGVDAPAWSAELIAATIDQSLRLLKTDVLDVMLLHSCDLATLKKGEALGALAAARNKGKIRFAGYSGDNEAAAWAAEQADVAVIETSINIADQVNIDQVLPVARKRNVGVIAKRPIANAAWKEISEQPGMYQSYARTYTERLRKMAISPEMFGLKGENAWMELALRFTLSFPEVHTAIIGTTNPEHAMRNFEIASRGALPVETVAKIRAAFRNADPKGEWAGQT